MTDQFELQVILSKGPDDVNASKTGHVIAATAALLGKRALLFLMNDAAAWALTDIESRSDIEELKNLFEFQQDILAADGRVQVCAACAEVLQGEGKHLRDGVEIGRLPSVVSRALDVQTLSF